MVLDAPPRCIESFIDHQPRLHEEKPTHRKHKSSSMAAQQESWFMRFHKSHTRLKNYVHTAWRVPLPWYGQVFMGCVYFTIPLVGGHYLMQWAISKSHENIGKRGEKLENEAVEGIGNQHDGKVIGAGGWGGGVRLANSDLETQKHNQEKLQRYLRIQKRKMEREERRRAKQAKVEAEN